MGNFSTMSKQVAVEADAEKPERENDAPARQKETSVTGIGERSTTKRSCFAQYGYREVAHKLS